MCNSEEYKHQAQIQTQLIRILIKEGKIEKAKRICERSEFKNSERIQSQLIKILIIEDRLEEAKKICEREEFKDEAVIQSQLITILMKEGRPEEAKKVCTREEFKNSEGIQSQLIKILMREGRLKEAKKICERDEFKKEESIQSQLVTILIRKKRLEEARKICERIEFKNSEVIQSQLITILMREGRFEEAKKIWEREEFKNSEGIQSQLITILMREERLEEARRICERKEFKNSKVIQSQLINIRKLIRRHERYSTIVRQKSLSGEQQDFLDYIKAKIYNNEFDENTINEIRQSQDIDEWEKSILLLAVYYRQRNRTLFDQELKSAKKSFKEDKEKIKKLNILANSLSFVKTILNFSAFDVLLGKEHREMSTDEEKEKSQVKEQTQKNEETIGDIFKEEISKIVKQAQGQKGIGQEEFKKLELISKSPYNDIRARMQLIIYLNKYGMSGIVGQRLKNENRIYQEVLRLVLIANDRPGIDEKNLRSSVTVQNVRRQIIMTGGDKKYADEVIERAIKRGKEDHEDR